jgi:hypothetical protein
MNIPVLNEMSFCYRFDILESGSHSSILTSQQFDLDFQSLILLNKALDSYVVVLIRD